MTTSTEVRVTPARNKEISSVLVLISFMLVISSFQLNATMLSPAIGDMATRLNTNPGVIGWSSTVFLSVAAALAVFFPPLADKIGRKKVTTISVAVMVVGTLIVLFTNSPALLILGRALQGFCGATFALGNLTLRAILDPKKYGFYIGLVAAVNSGVAGVDTLLGGVLTDAYGYKSVILVILVVEVLALLMVQLYVPETSIPAVANMDWMGAISLTGALWGLNMAVTFGFSQVGWTSPLTIAMFAITLISASAFFIVEKKHHDPLVPLSELAARSTWAQLGTTFFTMASAFAVLIYLIPAVSQDPKSFGMSSTTSAIMYLTPFSLAGWLVAPLVGSFAPRLGYRLVLRAGLIGTLVILGVMQFFGFGDKWLIFALALLMGVSYAGISNTCLNALGVLYASETRPGVLPGLTSAAFNLGAGMGIGVMASTVARSADNGYAAGLLVGLICAAIAVAISLFLPAKVGSEEKI